MSRCALLGAVHCPRMNEIRSRRTRDACAHIWRRDARCCTLCTTRAPSPAPRCLPPCCTTSSGACDSLYSYSAVHCGSAVRALLCVLCDSSAIACPAMPALLRHLFRCACASSFRFFRAGKSHRRVCSVQSIFEILRPGSNVRTIPVYSLDDAGEAFVPRLLSFLSMCSPLVYPYNLGPDIARCTAHNPENGTQQLNGLIPCAPLSMCSPSGYLYNLGPDIARSTAHTPGGSWALTSSTNSSNRALPCTHAASRCRTSRTLFLSSGIEPTLHQYAHPPTQHRAPVATVVAALKCLYGNAVRRPLAGIEEVPLAVISTPWGGTHASAFTPNHLSLKIDARGPAGPHLPGTIADVLDHARCDATLTPAVLLFLSLVCTLSVSLVCLCHSAQL